MSCGRCVTPPASSLGRPACKNQKHTHPKKNKQHTDVFTPRQLFKHFVPVLRSKSNRRCFQVHMPLPLPRQLVIFGLGEWECTETTIAVEVLVSAEVPAQKIGTLSAQARYVEGQACAFHNKTKREAECVKIDFELRCLTWEGDWSADIVTVAAERGRRGVYGKIVLTVCGEVRGFQLLVKRWLNCCQHKGKQTGL